MEALHTIPCDPFLGRADKEGFRRHHGFGVVGRNLHHGSYMAVARVRRGTRRVQHPLFLSRSRLGVVMAEDKTGPLYSVLSPYSCVTLLVADG